MQDDVARIAELYRHAGRLRRARSRRRRSRTGEGRVDLVFEIAEGAEDHGQAQSSSSATTAVRGLAAQGRDQDQPERPVRLPHDHRSSTIPTGSRPTATCCTACISSTASPTRASRRRATGAYDPAARRAFVVTFTVEEGEPLPVRHDRRRLEPRAGRRSRAREASSRCASGDVYDAERRRQVGRRPHHRARQAGISVRLRAAAGRARSRRRSTSISCSRSRRRRTPTSSASTIRGNSFTRDYVIRREFDIAEGDAYNRALVARAERRLKALDLFKSVKTIDRAGLGARPRRARCRHRGAGDRRLRHFGVGYSTVDGVVAEISVCRAQLPGPRPIREGVGDARSTICALGKLSFAAAVFARQPRDARPRRVRQADADRTANQSYGSTNYGAGIRLGAADHRRRERARCAIRSSTRACRSTRP